MERIRTSGTSLWAGEEKLFVRGVTYGPFRPNPLGEPFPEKSGVERDFRLLRQLGANAIRLYHPPPGWLVELGAESGLRLLVGVPWAQHVSFLDSPSARSDARQRVRQTAAALAEAPHLLGILVGNEISPQLVRWYGRERVAGFLGELVDEVRQAAPQALVSYANYPMTEYLEVTGLDFASFNVYLHQEEDLRRYLARLQNLTAPLPLLISELGVDSIREGERCQAKIVGRSLRAVAELGCAGSVLFSFTDEWHTGGFELEDWAFGLVTRERKRKPVFRAVARVFRSQLPPAPEPAPRVSVVVCAYQAERTLDECLTALRRLRYPDFEVIVVDDGSTDATRAIARRHPEARLVALDENHGLSAARNEGIRAATGEIVAFTDADCSPDPDWITLLVHRLLSGDFAGVGGPNLPPPEDDWRPEVVALSPGGPTHVLVSDELAEHVPGCNMAFWRERLLEIGLFDPAFRSAGDDVDLCWRLQDAGHRIGFAAGALVWHRRRHTFSAYLRQQCGYGRAEALLSLKHPARFNLLGHSKWLGRIYQHLGLGLLSGRPRVYGEPFGSGFFQTLYEPPASALRHLPVTVEWSALGAVLLLAGLLAWGVGTPLPLLLAAGLGLLSISLLHGIHEAWRVDVDGLPAIRARLTLALLSWLGPVARGVARWRQRWRQQVKGKRFELPRGGPPSEVGRRRFVLSYWNETGIQKQDCIAALLEVLRGGCYAVACDDGWQPWDLSVHAGVLWCARVSVLVEDHGQGRALVRVRTRLRPSAFTVLLRGVGVGGLAVAAAAGGAAAVGLVVLGIAAVEGGLAARARRVGRAVSGAVGKALANLPVEPLAEVHEQAAETGAAA